MNKRILLGIATLLAALLYACPADGGSSGSDSGINIAEEIKTQDPTLLYKADMHKDAQALFSRGDIDNPYLFSFGSTTVKNLEAITGEITITSGDAISYKETEGTMNPFWFDAHTDYQTYKTMEGMYMLDMSTLKAAASIDAITDDPSYDGTTYIVGIGPDEDKPIDYDTLAGDLTIRVRILYGEEVLKEETVQVSKADYYDVTTWRDLQHVQDDLKGSYEVKNDIIFPELDAYGYEKFRPIGYGYNKYENKKWFYAPAFEGIFKGNNYKIEGLYVNVGAHETPVGLFANVYRGTIQDITIYHRGMYSDHDGGFTGAEAAGGLVAILERGSTIKNCHVYSMNGEEIVSRQWVGGLIGGVRGVTQWKNTASTISDSSAHTDVRSIGFRAFGVGGLIGTMGVSDNNRVLRSYATGNVYGKKRVGGLIGQFASAGGRLEQVYATGYVEGETDVGALIGAIVSSGENYITGYATGDVIGGHNVGGLVGLFDGGLSTLIGYATGSVKGENNVGGVVGHQTWDFDSFDREAKSVTMNVYSVGDVIGDKNVGGVFGYLDATDFHSPSGKDVFLVYGGYARGAIASASPSVGLFVGGFKKIEGRNINSYVSSSTSKFTNVKEDQATGLNGNRITISEVTDANYEAKFDGFTFGDEVGQWTWEGNGKWPALNIGETVPTADQPIASSSYTPYIQEAQEEQTDKSLEGIERLEENVFKVYETYSWQSEKQRIENKIPQADFYPTGLYIKPNQTITVTVSSDTAHSTSNLNLLAGTYSRYEGENWDPDTFTLKVGENTITNTRNKPRLIYIQFVDRRRAFDVATVTIDGATKLPYFIRGKTTSKEFQSMLRNYDYDSVLIASDRIMMVVSKETALQVQNQDWQETADLLDKVVERAEYIHGLDSETDYDTPPTTRILAVERSGGGPMSATNYRISAPKGSAIGWIDNSKIIKDWGLWHEVGHMYESAQIVISETNVNIYSLAIERGFTQESRLVRDGTWNKIEAYLAKPATEKKFNEINVFMKLGMLQQLWLGYGSTEKERDKFFINLNKKVRKESKNIEPRGDEALAYLMLKASEVYGYNLNEFFRKWGIQLPQSAFDAVDALELEDPPVDPSSLSE